MAKASRFGKDDSSDSDLFLCIEDCEYNGQEWSAGDLTRFESGVRHPLTFLRVPDEHAEEIIDTLAKKKGKTGRKKAGKRLILGEHQESLRSVLTEAEIDISAFNRLLGRRLRAAHGELRKWKSGDLLRADLKGITHTTGIEFPIEVMTTREMRLVRSIFGDWKLDRAQRATEFDFSRRLEDFGFIWLLREKEFVHSPDFRTVRFKGEEFNFTTNESIVIKLLHEAKQKGIKWVTLDEINAALDRSESPVRARKMSGIFQNRERRERVFNVLIVSGKDAHERKYRLNI